MNSYSKTEGKLYRHYKNKKNITILQTRLSRTQNRIDSLRRNIKECDIDMECNVKGIDYSKEYIESNEISSSIERSLEKAIDKLLKELAYNIRDKHKTISRINNLQNQIDNMDYVLGKLTEEELQLVELKYSGSTFREIQEFLHIGTSTYYRKKDNIINFLIGELN